MAERNPKASSALGLPWSVWAHTQKETPNNSKNNNRKPWKEKSCPDRTLGFNYQQLHSGNNIKLSILFKKRLLQERYILVKNHHEGRRTAQAQRPPPQFLRGDRQGTIPDVPPPAASSSHQERAKRNRSDATSPPPEGGSVRKVSVRTWGNGGPPVCWRGCDTVQLCWTTAWGFLKTFHGERAGDPATRLPGSSPGTEGRDSGHYLHTMFTALFLTEGIPTRYLLTV